VPANWYRNGPDQEGKWFCFSFRKEIGSVLGLGFKEMESSLIFQWRYHKFPSQLDLPNVITSSVASAKEARTPWQVSV